MIDPMIVLSAAAERRLMVDLLTRFSATLGEAEVVADVLTEADLRGHESHGLARLNMQVTTLREGSVMGDRQPLLERDEPGALVVDGNRALGPPALSTAIGWAVERAERQGCCSVAVYNHGYTAYAGRYPELGLPRDCVCLLFGKSRGGAHPYGGRQPIVGTNPLACAIPTEGDPLLIDMSTSTSAIGKLMAAAREGKSIPADWAIDERGQPTIDPRAALRGALSPAGGAKGYALALLLEMLAGILAEGGRSPERLAEGGRRLWSSFAVVLHLGAFMDPAVFRRQASAYLAHVKASPTAPGFDEILLPGERAYRTRRQRLATGIPLPTETWEPAAAFCREAGLDPTAYLTSSRV